MTRREDPHATAPTLLLIEDDDGHAELIRRAFESHRSVCRIDRVTDGEAAMDYLLHRGAFASLQGAEPPRVVLMDLRIPKTEGLDLLRAIKSSPTLRSVPVVVLTTSDADRDVAAAYAAHANSYLVKPADYGTFSQLMLDIESYWMRWNLAAPTPKNGVGRRTSVGADVRAVTGSRAEGAFSTGSL